MIKRHIPNSLTCCNLICGCVATGCAFYGQYQYAVLMIFIGAVFDFFDGMVASALGVSSPIGKELDSLAFWSCTKRNHLLSFPRSTLSGNVDANKRISALYGLFDGCLFGFEVGKVQSRRTSAPTIHRSSNSSKCTLLGKSRFG